MDEKAVALAKGAILGEEDAYFASHGLADFLGRAGVESGPGAILALVRRLTEDDAYAFLAAISAGLRDLASDGDEFAHVVSGVAQKMRHEAAQGPLVNALVEIGRSRPGAAAGAAARLIDLGDADFGAYLIGGAYVAARPECDSEIERLLSSGSSTDAAAAVRALRVSSAEHGSPGTGRIKAAVRRAMLHADAGVQQEAMESLLDICGGDAEAAAMVESMATRHRATHPILAGRIRCGSPFDDEQSLRHLWTCIERNPEWGVVHSTYCALAEMADREPSEVARILLHMLDIGRYHSALAGWVLERLGKDHAPVAIAAVLGALENPRYDALDGRLESVVGRMMRFADCGEAAALVIRTMDERPAALDACLAVLSAIVVEDGRRGGGAELAASVMSRLSRHPACAGEGAGGAHGLGRVAGLDCVGMIRRARERMAA